MAATLITVATDGFRDYVDLPDGRQLNLGSVSVLKLVTTLVKGATSCRKALDTFLDKGAATISVDIRALEGLLRPRRSRWAGYGDSFIPVVSRQHLRGASMNPVQAITAQIESIESHLAALQQEAEQGKDTQEKTAHLRELVASLVGLVSQTEGEAIAVKLAALEATVEAISRSGSAPKVAVDTLHHLSSGLCELVTGKTAAVDEDAKRELDLYMENESRLNRQKQSIIQNILRKMKGGKYNHALAPKLWMYWVDEGAKMYIREFGGDVKTMFPKQLREELAKEIADHEEKLIKNGEYDHLKVAAEEEQDTEQEQAQGKEASEQETQESAQQEQAKEASDLPASEINEALAHSVMAKVESALRVVEASEKSGTIVAKKDLNTISTKLASLLESSDLGDTNLRVTLRELAGMADRVQSHFAAV